MQTKLVAVGVGAFSYGLLVGWAVTADRADQKLLASQRLMRKMMNTENEAFYASRTPVSDESLLDFDPVAYKAWAASKNVVETFGNDLPSGSPELAPIRGDEPAVVDIVMDAQSAAEIIEDPQSLIAFTKQTEYLETSEGQEMLAHVEEDLLGEPEEDVVPEGETVDETRSNLQALINQYTANPDESSAFVHHAVNSIKKSADPDYTPPFLISREKYAWDEDEGDEYAKITLVFHSRENVLLDDDQDPIDIDEYIGMRNLNRFGDESDDGDVMYIRNRRLLTDFEVIRDSENPPPIHVRYGMSREVFNSNKAAGNIRFREEDG